MARMIEVDEEVYNQNAKLRDKLRRIAANPKNAAALEAMEKEIEPNVATPHLDQQKAITEPVEALRKDFADFRKGIEDERAKEQEERTKGVLNAKWEAGRAWMLQNGFTEEGVKKIEEEVMAPNGITDHKIAAAYWEKEHPTPPPTTPVGGFGAWNFLDPQPEDKSNENIKNLIGSKGDNELVSDRMAREALNEFRQQVAGGRR
jgi:hypothetical protein